jgi:segregation and condensation protein B
VNPEQDSGSLADRAAAWVPPWERPAEREHADDQPRDDAPSDPNGLDDEAALDREIDADIVRQAGLPGPGTVESDVDAEIELTGQTAVPADADIAAGAEAEAESGVGTASVADAPPDLTAEVETDAGSGVGLDAATGPEDGTAAEVAAAVENAVGISPVDAEAGPESDAEAKDGAGSEGGAEAEPERDEEAGRDSGTAAGPEPDAAGWDSGTAAGPESDIDGDRGTLLAAGPSPLPGLAGAELGAALEAILMVVDEPVTEAQLADVLDVAPEDVAERLRALAADYAESARGFELRRAAGGWRFYTRAEFSGYVERFVLDGQSARLTQAALETLAVAAYQQPVTRSRISAIRGVNCDGVVRTLVTRGLLEESGTQPETGAYLYRTTTLFLEKLGLDSVDELPPLAPFLPDDVNGLTDAQR